MVVPISPPDGNKIWCDEWRVDGSYHSETISNYVFELTNVVARMLQVEYPGKLAGVYSYSNYSDVPSIDLEPNVIVGISTFARVVISTIIAPRISRATGAFRGCGFVWVGRRAATR